MLMQHASVAAAALIRLPQLSLHAPALHQLRQLHGHLPLVCIPLQGQASSSDIY